MSWAGVILGVGVGLCLIGVGMCVVTVDHRNQFGERPTDAGAMFIAAVSVLLGTALVCGVALA